MILNFIIFGKFFQMSNFRTDIQGLRAIAFIFVFFFHLCPHLLPGGFIGVDIFFVISGYLITGIILKRKEEGKFKFIDFYLNRAKRIFPAYFVMLTCVTISYLYVYLPQDIPTIAASIKYSCLFASNILFSEGDSYFGARMSENPVLHTWSLAIEMQFYFLLPFLLYYVRRRYLIRVLLSLLILLTLVSEICMNAYKGSMYFSLSARIPEFLIGSILSMIGVWKAERKSTQVMTITAVVLLVMCSIFFNEDMHFPGYTSLLPCILVGVVMISGNNLITRFLSLSIFQFIGKISYSLYLWHWPIMAYMRYRNGLNEGYSFSFSEIILICILTFLLGFMSYTFIEKKINDVKRLVWLMFFVALALGVVYFYIPTYIRKTTVPIEFRGPSFGTISHYKDSIETFGLKDVNDSYVFLFGNSHALALKPFFDQLGKDIGFSFRTITSDLFPALEGLKSEEIAVKDVNFFHYSQSILKTTQLEIRKNRILILCLNDYALIPSIRTAIDTLASNLRPDQRLILVNSFPVFDKNPMRINNGVLKRSNATFAKLDRSKSIAVIDSLKNTHANIWVLDLNKTSLFKDGPFYRDTLLYYDSGHLNQFGARRLANAFERSFSELIKFKRELKQY